jgi:WD40 repeat protein
MVRLWNLKGKSLREYKGSDEIVTSVCVNDETKHVFAGTFSGQLKTWRLNNGQPRGDLATNPHPER